MALRLLFFAQCAEWMGRRELEAQVAGPSALIDVILGLPALAPVLRHQDQLKVAVNCEYVGFDSEVHDGDEIAFLPPVSGG